MRGTDSGPRRLWSINTRGFQNLGTVPVPRGQAPVCLAIAVTPCRTKACRQGYRGFLQHLLVFSTKFIAVATASLAGTSSTNRHEAMLYLVREGAHCELTHCSIACTVEQKKNPQF